MGEWVGGWEEVSVNTAMSSESVVFNIFRYVLMVCVGGRKVSR